MKYYKKNINYPRTLSSHFVDLWSDFDPMRWLHSASIYRRMQHLNTKSLLLVKYVSLLFLKFFFPNLFVHVLHSIKRNMKIQISCRLKIRLFH